MSYIDHKSRLFRDSGDIPEVIPKRSEGRIKSYPSATDARAWCNETEDRRQHILDLIRADYSKCMGKYVPIDVLVNTLLANKTADASKLKQQVDELQKLLDVYSKLNLTEDQKRMLEGMKRDMGIAIESLSDTSGSKGKSPRSLEEAKIGTDLQTGTAEMTAATDTGRKAIGMIEAPGATGAVGISGATGAPPGADGISGATGAPPGADGISGATGAPPGAAGISGATGTAGALGIAEADTGQVCNAVAKLKEQAQQCDTLDNYSNNDLKSLVIQKDAQIVALKILLEAKNAECEEQSKVGRAAVGKLETLKNIVEERDGLQKKLKESMTQIKTLKSRVEDPCVQEISALEDEIERLKTKGQLSAAEETEVIRKEVSVLKKYCVKLSNIQEENQKLKVQIERLQEIAGVPGNYKDSLEDSSDPKQLKKRIGELQGRLEKLDEIMDERDKLKQRVRQLEDELEKYEMLPEEVELFRQKSEILDDVLNERDNLRKRLEKLKGIEQQVAELKKKADKVDRLQNELNAINREMGNIKRSSQNEIKSLNKDQENLKMRLEKEGNCVRCHAIEIEQLKMERDELETKLNRLSSIEEDYKKLLDKMRDMDSMKNENDIYRDKYKQMLDLECECDMLRAQVCRFNNLEKDRKTLLRQVRECDCCIADQEEEIRKLVCHIDRTSEDNNKQQERTQRALCDLRMQVEQKDGIIITSEQQLANVQNQLKNTIKEVSCEKSCLKNRITQLEQTLHDKEQQGVESDRYLKQMVKQSKCALVKISKEMGKYCQEQDVISEKLTAEDGNRIQELEEQLAKANETIAKLREELKVELVKANETTAKLREELEGELAQSNETTTKLREELEGELTKSNETIAKLREELEGEVAKANETTTKLREELERELAKSNETIAKLREESAKVDLLSAENEELRRLSNDVQQKATEQVSELNDELERLRAENNELKMNLKNLSSSAAQMEKETEAILQQTQQLTKDKFVLESENESLKKQLEHLKAAASDGAELEVLRREKETLLMQIDEQKREITALIQSTKDARKKTAAAEQKEKARMQALLDSAEAQIKNIEKGPDIQPPPIRASQDTQINADVEELQGLKNLLKKQKKESTEAITTLKAQHEREVKNVHGKYNDGIAKLQGSHEEVLKDISKDHENEVESLRSALRTSKETILSMYKQTSSKGTEAIKPNLSVTTTEQVNITHKMADKKQSADIKQSFTHQSVGVKKETCTCRLEDILRKALDSGMQSLTYEEVKLLHKQTVDATAVLLGTSKDNSISDKHELLTRINSLENDLMRKQKHAQQKGALQIAVKMERKRLQELKLLLNEEKRMNCELMCTVGAQARVVANMEVERDMMRRQSSYHEERVQTLLIDCQEKKKQMRYMEEDLEMSKRQQRNDADVLNVLQYNFQNNANVSKLILSILGDAHSIRKSVNSEMILKLQLKDCTGPVPCKCQIQHVPVKDRNVTDSDASRSANKTFYTELIIQDTTRRCNKPQCGNICKGRYLCNDQSNSPKSSDLN